MSARALDNSVAATALGRGPGLHVVNNGSSGLALQKRNFIVEVIIAVTILLVVIAALQLLRANAISTAVTARYGEGAKYAFRAAVVVILATAALAFAGLLLQNWWRRELEQALAQSESLVSLFAEASKTGFWQFDFGSNEIRANRETRELLRIPRDRVVRLSDVGDAMHPEDRGPALAAIERGIQEKSGFEVEFRLLPTAGHERWIHLTARPVHGAGSGAICLSGTTQDVTEQAELKFEIERQRESLAHLTRVSMVGKLSSSLAHELNQPLAAIMSNAQAAERMMQNAPLDVRELKAIIGDIIRDDARAGDIIRHLRGLLKNSADLFEELDFTSVVHSALEIAVGDLVERHILVNKRFCDQPLPIRGDSVQLQQVILNLLLNASEAISDAAQTDGAITLTTDILSDGCAHLSVSDTGSGISADCFEKLFDPFFTTKDGGLGLGLALCRTIVTRHGGRIWATNNFNTGATFHVSLPIRQPEPI